MGFFIAPLTLQSGDFQTWRLTATTDTLTGAPSQFAYFLENVGRTGAGCALRFASFPVQCTTDSPDKIDLWNEAGPDQVDARGGKVGVGGGDRRWFLVYVLSTQVYTYQGKDLAEK